MVETLTGGIMPNDSMPGYSSLDDIRSSNGAIVNSRLDNNMTDNASPGDASPDISPEDQHPGCKCKKSG